VLLFAAVGAVWVIRHPTTMRLFLIWAFAGSLGVYMWASERFAWLVLHPLLPLILLAGIGVQAAWRSRRRAVRFAGVVAAGAGLAYAGYASYTVNARYGADPREWLVTTQSSVDVKNVADRVLEIDQRVRRRTGEPVTITVDSGQGATFPYAWYFRHLQVGYIDMTTPNYVPDTQVLIMTEQARVALLPNLAAYDGQQFRFRVWWVRDWSKKLDAGAWWAWFTEREPWNETGGMPEWLYVRTDAEAAG
jgi:predicted membrane-bound mannosyltransferase